MLLFVHILLMYIPGKVPRRKETKYKNWVASHVILISLILIPCVLGGNELFIQERNFLLM